MAAMFWTFLCALVAHGAAQFDGYTGIDINKDKAMVSFGKDKEIKMYNARNDRRALKIEAGSVDFQADSVTMNGKPLGGGGDCGACGELLKLWKASNGNGNAKPCGPDGTDSHFQGTPTCQAGWKGQFCNEKAPAENKKCVCKNGSPQTGAGCKKNGANLCKSCYSGYYRNFQGTSCETPKEFAWTDSARTTWNEAKRICIANGRQLCTMAQLCPTKKGSAVSEAVWRSKTKDDSWVPYADVIDNWVQLGRKSDNRQCRSHQEAHGGSNKPCKGNNKDPNNPACGTKHDTVVCCPDEGGPKELKWADVSKTTWNEAKRICKQDGRRLCKMKELCPAHKPNGRTEAVFRSVYKDDSWVPYADVVDNWVQLGRKSDSRTCRSHQEAHGGSNKPCKGNNKDPNNPACGMKHDSIVCCGGQDLDLSNLNVCTCKNGTPKTGAACTKDGAKQCASCKNGYYRNWKENSCEPPKGYVWENAGKTTWNEAKKLCYSKGQQLCTLAQLCPTQTKKGRTDAVWRHETKDDAWVPYKDVIDNWVQLGKGSQSRTCRTHQEAHGGNNKPCKGNNVDPNNPACGTKHDSIVCCPDTGGPREYDWENNGKTTWNEAKRICEKNGRQLCMMDELCPFHKGGGRTDAIYRSSTKDDAWVPYADVVDNWVQLGRKSDSRTCRTHQQAHGNNNKPCKGNNVDPNNPACGTKHDSVVCCVDHGFPRLVEWTNTAKTTWNEAKRICEEDARRLCKMEELCPAAKPSGRTAATIRHVTKSDAWVPYADVVDNWVQLGKASDDRTCRTHQQAHGGNNKPCKGNNVDPNTPSCGTKHDSIVCCGKDIDTGYPKEFEWTDNGKTTWNEAKRICTAHGRKLCQLNELCPSHTPSGRTEATFRSVRKDDAWVPYADVVDNWVQLGKASQSRTCRSHQEAHGGSNKPCKGKNVDPNNPACGTKHDSVVCCGHDLDMGPKELAWENSGKSTWNEAQKICEADGRQLCTMAELCPHHHKGGRTNAMWRSKTKDDAWVPYADQVDNWVQLGRKSDSRTCRSHQHAHGGSNKPCKGNNVNANNPACGLKHDTVVCCINTGGPQELQWTNIAKTTWNEAKRICEATGRRLCKMKELCPDHKAGGRTDAIFRSFTKDDAWVPYADQVDNWVQLGKKSDSRTCRTHQQAHGGSNKPCKGNNVNPNNPACGLKHDTVVCCSD